MTLRLALVLILVLGLVLPLAHGGDYWPRSQTVTPGTPRLPGYDPHDTSTVTLREEFCSGTAGTSGQVGALGFSRSPIIGTVSGARQPPVPPRDLCVIRTSSVG